MAMQMNFSPDRVRELSASKRDGRNCGSFRSSAFLVTSQKHVAVAVFTAATKGTAPMITFTTPGPEQPSGTSSTHQCQVSLPSDCVLGHAMIDILAAAFWHFGGQALTAYQLAYVLTDEASVKRGRTRRMRPMTGPTNY